MIGKDIAHSLKLLIKGDVDESSDTLTKYSHDASLFEIRPQIVIFPKDTSDVQAVVKWVSDHKKTNPALSITARSAGTDMSGGALGDSIILDFTRYMNAVKEVTDETAVVEPGCFYRDFEKRTLERKRIMPAYTASREICAVGGMVANNSGGEKTIKYGKAERYIAYLNVVFSDGEVYTITALSKKELDQKCRQDNFEGNIYREMRDLIFSNKERVVAAKPNVSKNSAGYYLWNVYDEKTETFDLCRLIVGSQGTLGIITEIGFKLVPVAPYSGVLAIFMPSIDKLPDVVNEVMPFGPDSFESYDDYSLKLAVKFFFDFFKHLGFTRTIHLGLQFIPEVMLILTGGIPKLTLIVEFSGNSTNEIQGRLHKLQEKIKHFGFKSRIARDAGEAEKYWEVRRESFNMLRKHVHHRRTAPFIDDVIVRVEHLPTFLPKLEAILEEYKLIYTVAGHAGDGNFHIIPLIDLDSPFSTDVILEISQKVYKLVNEYKGSITAEHNDGIIRTPYLEEMYGKKIIELFKKTKEIFDPLYILNPGKKVGGTFEDIKKNLIRKNN